MKLNNIHPLKNSKFKRKRICRGIGSGNGKTGGRGHKGQKSRSGYKINKLFQGGQTSIYRRLPKFGFNRIKKNKIFELKLSKLNLINDINININILKEKKLIKKNINLIKLIFDYNINRKIILKNILFSKNVLKSIENNGGSIEI
ncbi:50S ribosomal protein L15 [endosymbiont of Pachyrhynchus infernalis]|uniref:50S ribosomal protein L15 n=1 Tax=endosymbiont of Pachyrhynchus infernalis TaxID=1971488 RepID=UPI000DC700C8|nr:50S ribosomal protein L15 [endosymbiont of Pachyrhynchus infernalis]BBA84850.1 50S ribosomal protein L15 [endosymbiont of Pachyrhynchus infernalis]